MQLHLSPQPRPTSHPDDPIPPAPTVSPWAQEEVKKAQDLGLVPDHQPKDYLVPREQFTEVALTTAA